MTEVEQQAPAPTTEAPAKEEVVEEKKVEAEGENKDEEKKDEEKKEDAEKEEKVKFLSTVTLDGIIINIYVKIYVITNIIYFISLQSNFIAQEGKEGKGQEGKGAKRTSSTSTTSSSQERLRKGHRLSLPISTLPKSAQRFTKMLKSGNLVEASWNKI